MLYCSSRVVSVIPIVDVNYWGESTTSTMGNTRSLDARGKAENRLEGKDSVLAISQGTQFCECTEIIVNCLHVLYSENKLIRWVVL